MIYEKAYAKVNINLQVKNKRNDGFHELESLVLPLDFCDEMIFEFSHENEVISNVYIKDNIVLKTIELFQKEFNLNKPVKVILNKKIPVGSGLGGGSANISATLRGLNKLYNLNLELNELELLANKLGSDTLFCLYNKPAIISGRGDKISFINYDEIMSVLIILLPLIILTKDVFNNHVIDTKNHANILEYNDNDLLKTLLNNNEKFNAMYHKIQQVVPHVKMSGSGPTLFVTNYTEDILKKLQLIKDINLLSVKILK